ncbi:right-handed parallel beta-helix repeat-containing protein [Candidatus Acetothermia bacterium]|nr:right-handed parallel beta-helix repeat-containing protein [Candidatus Acetothermia bacterium]
MLGFGAILAFIALAAGHNGQAGFAQAPCTVMVSAGSPIQAAIDSASAGAVICVEAGSYSENLTIRNKQDLTLQGAGRDNVTLDGSAGIATKKAAIAIEKSEKITIQGFKIVNSRRAIDALNTKQLIVTDNRFEKNLRQSLLLDASEAELRNNLVLNTQKDIDGENGIGIQTFNSVFALDNVTVSGSAAEGISAQGDPSELGSTLTIQKCTFTNNGRAIALTSHSKATIRQSTITDNGDLAGIALYESATATIEDNTILRNGYAGVFAQDSTDVVVTHNRIAENKSARDKKEGGGVVLRDNSHATIRDNTISGNAQFGVAMFHRSQATLVNNTIAENASRGINLAGSAQATIQENTIARNQADGVLLLESAQATIQKNAFADNNSPGISMRNNSRATIEENLITGNIFAGMHLAEASEAMIIKNEIKSNRADSQA